MSDPIMSPDGKSMWTGAEWIPAPPTSGSAALSMQDSVVMGNVVTNKTTVVMDDRVGSIENFLDLMSEAYNSGKWQKGLNFFGEAKKINLSKCLDLYNKHYRHKINEIRCANIIRMMKNSEGMNGATVTNSERRQLCVLHWTEIHDVYLEIKNDKSLKHQLFALNKLVELLGIWFEVRLTWNRLPASDYLLEEYISIEAEDRGIAAIDSMFEFRYQRSREDFLSTLRFVFFMIIASGVVISFFLYA